MKTLKTCKACLLEKTFDCFYKRPDSLDGYRAVCKTCIAIKHANYYIKNKDKIITHFIDINGKEYNPSE